MQHLVPCMTSKLCCARLPAGQCLYMSEELCEQSSTRSFICLHTILQMNMTTVILYKCCVVYIRFLLNEAHELEHRSQQAHRDISACYPGLRKGTLSKASNDPFTVQLAVDTHCKHSQHKQDKHYQHRVRLLSLISFFTPQHVNEFRRFKIATIKAFKLSALSKLRIAPAAAHLYDNFSV